MMKEGLDFLAKANYSAIEIRMISGRVPLLRKDFSEMENKERAMLLINLINNWSLKNSGISKTFIYS